MPLDKVVAITGASAGIGRATARLLARRGASVVVSARRRDRLDALTREIADDGGRAIAVTADVTQASDMQGLVDAAVGHFNRLDVMICNAGFGVYGAIDTISPSQMQHVIDVNYMGTYHAIRAALPVFRARGRGHLVIVSSIAGKRGIPFMGAYAATKFAQVGLAECLRSELRGTGIDLSLVLPVSTETEFFQVMTRESGFTTLAEGPRQSAESVAEAIARTIERPVAEVYPFRKARGLAWLNALAPAFCDRVVRKWGREPVRA